MFAKQGHKIENRMKIMGNIGIKVNGAIVEIETATVYYRANRL